MECVRKVALIVVRCVRTRGRHRQPLLVCLVRREARHLLGPCGSVTKMLDQNTAQVFGVHLNATGTSACKSEIHGRYRPKDPRIVSIDPAPAEGNSEGLAAHEAKLERKPKRERVPQRTRRHFGRGEG